MSPARHGTRRWLAGLAASVVLSAGLALAGGSTGTAALAPAAMLGAGSPADCRASLGQDLQHRGPALDPRELGMLVWNVHKQAHPDWREDFAALATDADLVLVQEAAYHVDGRPAPPADAATASFAPGYRTRTQVTGVLTLARTPPLGACAMTTVEPLLRTPKATAVTRYPLAGRRHDLVVVNLHAVNFSLGLGAYRRQLADIEAAVGHHAGPLIVAGDFNTWHGGRAALVESLAARLGLAAVRFDPDRRTRVGGRAIDHIYARGVEVLAQDVPANASSDHAPLRAAFRVPAAQPSELTAEL